MLNTTQKAAKQLINIYGQGKLLVQSTPNHRFYLGASEASAGRWVAAGDLHPGDSLWLFGQRRIAIDSLVRVDTVITVYNFEVANYHTYYVGKQCILVHNDCSTQLPEMLVEVQELGKSAVQSILARAQSVSKQLQSNQRSNPKLKVVKSKVSIKVKRNKVSGFYPYSLSFQGKKQDINQSKAPKLMADVYLGKQKVFKYNEDLDNNKPGGSAYNEKYVLAIFRDMIYAQQNSQPEQKDVHCLMFPIIPHPPARPQIFAVFSFGAF